MEPTEVSPMLLIATKERLEAQIKAYLAENLERFHHLYDHGGLRNKPDTLEEYLDNVKYGGLMNNFPGFFSIDDGDSYYVDIAKQLGILDLTGQEQIDRSRKNDEEDRQRINQRRAEEGKPPINFPVSEGRPHSNLWLSQTGRQFYETVEKAAELEHFKPKPETGRVTNKEVFPVFVRLVAMGYLPDELAR